MRWKTYRRLRALDKQLERQWNGWIQTTAHRPRLKMDDDFVVRLEAQTAPVISYAGTARLASVLNLELQRRRLCGFRRRASAAR